MSDPTSKPAADPVDDWRTRWMLPICAVIGGGIFIDTSLRGAHINLPMLVASLAATLLGAVVLTDRIAAQLIRDEPRRQRLNQQAQFATNGLLVTMAATFAIYEAAGAIRHMRPMGMAQGVVAQSHTSRGSRGTRYLYLDLPGQPETFRWSCKWDCAAFDSLASLDGREIRLEHIDDEILGVQTPAGTLLDAEASRQGDIAADAVFGLLSGGAAIAIAVQMIRRRRREATVAATGTVQ